MSVRNSSSLDPWLDLYDPYGNRLASDDDSGGNHDSLISMPLPYSGLYTVIARDYSTGYGPFTLELRQIIQPDQPYFGDISTVGLQYRYLFNATVGQHVSISMIKDTNGLDPWLDLRDPTGVIVVSDDDSCGNSNSCINNYRLERSGAYTIIARTYNDASTGQFSLSLSVD
jgi:hypothetical protein